MSTATSTAQPYVLGHAESEMERLTRQARYLGELSELLLRRAGLRPGMRVLDVGSGAGDVSFLAARIVGRQGCVVGIDRAAQSVALAGRRAADAGLTNVSFVEADAETYADPDGAPFDAVVGRFVLMYLADVPGTLAGLARLVRPGGIVSFQEYVISVMLGVPATPLISTSLDRVNEAFERSGAETRMGMLLPAVFRAAGLDPQLLMTGRIEHGPHSDGLEQLVGVTRTLAPAMIATGVATADEIDIDTLPARLSAEAAEFGVTVMTPPLVGAWARVPSGLPRPR